MPAKPQTTSKSPVLLVILALFFLFVVAGLAGLYFMRSFNLPVSLPGNLSGLVGLPGVAMRATESDFAFVDDPLVRKHMAAQANVTAFRMRSHDLIGTKGSYTVFETQLTGSDMAYASWREADSKKSEELISMGETIFVKDYKDNAWWKQVNKPEAKPTGIEEPMKEPADFKKEYENLKTKPPEFEKMGEETCGPSADGLTCYKYKEVDESNPEASRLFWFDTQKYLLRKEESGFGEWRAAVEYEYDNIYVKAPSPTKDVPEGKNIYEYMTGQPEPSVPGINTRPIIAPPSQDEPFNDDTAG